MRFSLISAAAFSALAIASAAAAQPADNAGSPLALKAGEWVRTSDGAPVGRIEYVDKAKDGSPTGVAVIYDMRVVHIPAASLSAGQKGYVTSLAKADVSKLR
jgi:hypothetical protein